jgi:hypothetical protein
MTSHIRNLRRLALLTATSALLLAAGTATASAATVDATPDTELSKTEATTLEVTGTEFAKETLFRVGLCSTKPYGFFGIPACGEMLEVESDANGEISAELEVERTTFNVHSQIEPPANGGQPEFFTCAGNPLIHDRCDVVVAEHGGKKAILAGESVTFKP